MLEAARSIMVRLRARDAAELAELGIDPDTAATAFASPAVLARVFAYEDRPAAIVAFHCLTPKTVAASLMATDDWPRVARGVVRWGVREARPALLRQGFARAECRTMEGHDPAIRLLERLGFVCECRVPNFGASGAAFLQYAWRLDDHAPNSARRRRPRRHPAADTGFQEEELNERKRLAKRKGFSALTPFAVARQPRTPRCRNAACG
jgi:RimJ/RimL family protein N-acetyltransferase